MRGRWTSSRRRASTWCSPRRRTGRSRSTTTRKVSLGHIGGYEAFLDELDKVWRDCFDALVPGGRLICVVGDVCLSRRRNLGVHEVVPLHASIQERCRRIGFTNLAPIIWHKIANAAFESSGNGGGFLGKPYEPNAVIKNDIEFYDATQARRLPHADGAQAPALGDPRSAAPGVVPAGVDRADRRFDPRASGAVSGRARRAAGAYFSFVGDTVLDPFMGTGTTAVAAAKWGRNSIGVEISREYAELARRRFERDANHLFSVAELATADVDPQPARAREAAA